MRVGKNNATPHSKHLLAILLVVIIATNSIAAFFVLVQQAEAQGLQLRVSVAENPAFENHFFGAQIVEVIIDDPGATDPDESTVGLTVMGFTANRVHLSDGLWYAFIAEDQGFGILLDVLTDGLRNNVIFVSDAVNDSGATATIGGTVFTIVTSQNDSFVKEIEVVGGLPFIEVNQADIFTTLPQPFFEGSTTVNPDLRIGPVNEGNNLCDTAGGGLSTGTGTGDPDCDWPYIRLVGLEELDTMEVRAGAASVVLTFDDFAESISSKLDRTTDYPLNAEVIIQYTDFMFNINPVEEDGAFFVLDRSTGRPARIIYQPVGAFDPAGNGQNFPDILPVFTTSPGLEFDERQVLELDAPEGINSIRFIHAFSAANNAIVSFVPEPFTHVSENARAVSQFDSALEIFRIGSAASLGIAAAGDLSPVIRMFETDPNTSVLISTVEPQGGRSVIFAGVNDRVASFDYFDIINSATTRTHDGFVSVDREIYDSADRAVFTVTDPDQNLRSRISEEPSGRESGTFIRVGNPFPLVNTRNTVTGISNTLVDNIERIWVASPLPATGDANTFGITLGAGNEGLNILADVNNSNVIDSVLAGTDGTDSTERFHADSGDIVQATISTNNRRLAAVFTAPTTPPQPLSTIVIDTRLTIDDINDVLTLTGVTGAQILGQVYVDNLQDATFDQLENFLVQVAEIDSNGATAGGILGQDVAGGIVTTTTYDVRMPRYNLINLDLTDLVTTAPFASAVVKIEAVDPTCIPANTSTGADAVASTLAFDNDLDNDGDAAEGDRCVHASQIVDFQIVEATGLDTDASATTGDDYDAVVTPVFPPYNTLVSPATTDIGFDRDPLPGRVGVGTFRPLDLERVADTNFGGNHLLDRIRVTMMLLDTATPAEPAEVIVPLVSQAVVVDIGGLGTIFQPAPNPACGGLALACTSVPNMQSGVTTPDIAGSPIGHAFSNLVYRLELDEDGSNSSVFTGRADFMTFLQFDTVPDVIADIVLTGDPLKIWLPNRFIPPNRLALVNLDEDIVRFFREVSATFIYETRDGSVEWDRSSFSSGQDAFLTITDEDLNRRPDATERYNLPVDSFVFFELGKQRVDSSCALGSADCFFNQIDATLLETGPNTGTFVSQITMPRAIRVNTAAVGAAPVFATQVTQQRDLEVNYIDIRDRSSVRQEFDDVTNIRTTLGDVVLDRSAYPPGAIMYVEIHDNDFNNDVDIRETIDLRLLVAKDATTGTIGTFAEGTLFGPGQTPVPQQCDTEGEFNAFASNGACAALAPILEITIFKTIGKLATLLPVGLANMPADGVDTTTATGLVDRFGTGVTTGVDATPRAILPILDGKGLPVTTATETGPNTGIFEFEVQLPGPGLVGPFQTPPPAILTTGTVDKPVITANLPIQVTYFDRSDESGEVEDEEELASFLFNTASIASDKPAYHLGEQVILWIVEPDRNLDSRTVEFIPFNEFFIITDKADELPLDVLIFVLNLLGEFITTEPGFREIEPNAGIFAIIAPEGVVDEVVIDRGEQAEIIFFDKTPSGGGTEIRVEYEVEILEVMPEIIFDKEEYTPFDEVEVRIVSPDSNGEPFEVDTVRALVSSSSQGGFLLNVPETGLNTGIFEEDFDLTPNTDMFTGDLVAQREDGISVEFRIDEDTVVTNSVFVNYHVGNVMFDRDVYRTTDRAVVGVIDPDENKNPDTIDTLDARIWSTSDRGGLLVTLRETGDRTGIFEEFITFTTDEESTGTRLRVLNGDTVTVKYTDRTLPAPAALDNDGIFTVEVEELFASSLIGIKGPPLERAPASEPILVDQEGLPMEQVELEQQVLIQSEITNIQNVRQKFAYIVQVKDSNNITISLSWVSGELPARDSIIAAQSWIPERVGRYKIEVFVWESIDNPVALSPIRAVSVTVS